jgi:hypothetical protein
MAWQTHAAAVAGVNRTFEVYHQDDALGCGPACVAMVMETWGMIPNVTLVKAWFSRYENRLMPNTGARPNRVLQPWAVHQTNVNDIVGVLNQHKGFGTPQLHTGPAVISAVGNCAPHKPGIMRIHWGAGGPPGAGHFIVCYGSFGNDFVYLDPFYGLVVNAPPVAPPFYFVNLTTYGLISHLITIG